MCVIFVLRPGYTIPFQLLFNACNNNPHGYGIVIKRAGVPLDVIREFDEKGNDPEKIFKILKDNEDAERYVHLRYRTQGNVSEGNTQPFTVFMNDTRRVEFMHNGTLGNYTHNQTYQYGRPGFQGAEVNEDSDSKRFAQEVLQRYLPVLCGDKGPGDYSDTMVKELLEKYWSGGHNKGLLIANDLPPFFFGISSWETVKTAETINGELVEGALFASNNDYFTVLKRGPLFDSREKERREKEAQERAKEKGSSNPQEQGNVVLLKGPTLFGKRHGFSEGFSNLMEDLDLYKDEGYCAIANMTYHETLKMVEEMSQEDNACLLMYLTSFLKANTEKLNEFLKEEKRKSVHVG